MTFADYVDELMDTPPRALRQLIENYAGQCGMGEPLAAMHLTSEQRLCTAIAALYKQADADAALQRHPVLASIFPIVDRLEEHRDVSRMARELREFFALELAFDTAAKFMEPGNG